MQKKLKDKDTSINKDFPRETMKLRKELWEKVKKHRDKGKIAYLQYRAVDVKQKNKSELNLARLEFKGLS